MTAIQVATLCGLACLVMPMTWVLGTLTLSPSDGGNGLGIFADGLRIVWSLQALALAILVPAESARTTRRELVALFAVVMLVPWPFVALAFLAGAATPQALATTAAAILGAFAAVAAALRWATRGYVFMEDPRVVTTCQVCLVLIILIGYGKWSAWIL